MHVCRNNLLVLPCSWTMGLAGHRTMARDDPAETLDMAWRDRFRLEQRMVLDLFHFLAFPSCASTIALSPIPPSTSILQSPSFGIDGAEALRTHQGSRTIACEERSRPGERINGGCKQRVHTRSGSRERRALCVCVCVCVCVHNHHQIQIHRLHPFDIQHTL
ncbi:hypothetical protein DB88DRAFT_288130 [Papiliotrema laurentii]|uniref:Uncharacterized protein n=1 Tax=Papiliotrema laurentii TaxID=5418 RepID=A0AAD9FQS7_PAPLA|nr:hypothetical protein DB88DRAFT_288130 [Papiliotrema laurentii]